MHVLGCALQRTAVLGFTASCCSGPCSSTETDVLTLAARLCTATLRPVLVLSGSVVLVNVANRSH